MVEVKHTATLDMSDEWAFEDRAIDNILIAFGNFASESADMFNICISTEYFKEQFAGDGFDYGFLAEMRDKFCEKFCEYANVEIVNREDSNGN